MTQSSARRVEEAQEKDSAAAAKKKPIHCDVEQCGMPAMCSLELQCFCLQHFIMHCYEHLGRCKAFRFLDSEADCESEDRFLQECAEQASQLVSPLRGFDNLDRARLFDIFLWATELSANRGTLKSCKEVNPQAACELTQVPGAHRKVAGLPGFRQG